MQTNRRMLRAKMSKAKQEFVQGIAKAVEAGCNEAKTLNDALQPVKSAPPTSPSIKNNQT
jgi:hypothetical protein